MDDSESLDLFGPFRSSESITPACSYAEIYMLLHIFSVGIFILQCNDEIPNAFSIALQQHE